MRFVQIIAKKKGLETKPVVRGSGSNTLIMLRVDTLSECPECILTLNDNLSFRLWLQAIGIERDYQKC